MLLRNRPREATCPFLAKVDYDPSTSIAPPASDAYCSQSGHPLSSSDPCLSANSDCIWICDHFLASIFPYACLRLADPNNLSYLVAICWTSCENRSTRQAIGLARYRCYSVGSRPYNSSAAVPSNPNRHPPDSLQFGTGKRIASNFDMGPYWKSYHSLITDQAPSYFPWNLKCPFSLMTSAFLPAYQAARMSVAWLPPPKVSPMDSNRSNYCSSNSWNPFFMLCLTISCCKPTTNSTTTVNCCYSSSFRNYCRFDRAFCNCLVSVPSP